MLTKLAADTAMNGTNRCNSGDALCKQNINTLQPYSYVTRLNRTNSVLRCMKKMCIKLILRSKSQKLLEHSNVFYCKMAKCDYFVAEVCIDY